MVQPFAQWKANQVTNDATVRHRQLRLHDAKAFQPLLPNQEEANYLINYHATSDTFDKVDFPQLKKNEAMAAELMVEWPMRRNGSGRDSRALRSKQRSRRLISTIR